MISKNIQTGQPKILGEKMVVINIGLVTFEESLRQQGIEVVAVRWKPPRENPSDIEELLKHLL